MKSRVPVSVYNMFNESVRDSNFLVCLPKLYLNVSQYNFVFRSSTLWNSLIGNILEKSTPEENGIVIKGSTKNSDLSAPIQFVKNKIKHILLARQKSGNLDLWEPGNSCN